MPQERVSLRKIREVLRLKWEHGFSHRQIVASCHLGQGTVGEYLRRARAAGLTWPLPDDHFKTVFAYDVLEHLDDLVATMEDIHRVCQPGAVLTVTVPHFSCANAFTDPTHRHYFGLRSFNYFTGDNEFAHALPVA